MPQKQRVSSRSKQRPAPLAAVRRVPWYRVLPLAAVTVLGLASFVFSFAPSPLFRSLYPLAYEAEILASSEAHDVDPCLTAAIIEVESGWHPSATSSKDAQGLMQLLPQTAQDMVDLGIVDGRAFDPSHLDDPATNIEMGCAYLAYLIDFFHGSTDEAIAAYNAGLAHVLDWSQEETVLHNAITFPETQAYLIRVNNAWMRYRELYGQELMVASGTEAPASVG